MIPKWYVSDTMPVVVPGSWLKQECWHFSSASKVQMTKQLAAPSSSLHCVARLVKRLAWHISGGFKLWECAVDLSIYLCTLWSVTKDTGLSSSFGSSAGTKKVLDLGCGHGLPGILASCLGMQAHFQVLLSSIYTWTLTVLFLKYYTATVTLHESCNCAFHEGSNYTGPMCIGLSNISLSSMSHSRRTSTTA